MGNFKRKGPGKPRSKPRSRGRPHRSAGSRPSGRDRAGNRSFDRKDRDKRSRMHSVICDKCGKRCEVPFNPTEGKPVYCSDCFVKDDSKGRDIPGLKQINEKLDKIMKALSIDD